MPQTERPLSPALNILLWVLRILVGGLFIFSGFVKAIDISGFSYKLNDYWAVFGMDFMTPFSLFLAWLISVAEMAIGFALIVGYKMRINGWILLLMILFFTFLTGYSAISGKVTDCGCFGDAIPLEPIESFYKDIILTILILPLFIFRKRIRPVTENFLPAAVTFGSFVIFGVLSWWCYNHLPIIDFRPYKVGANLCDVALPTEANDYEPPAHDYMSVGMDCDEAGEFGSECKGKLVLIIYKKIEESPAEALKHTDELHEALKGTDIKVWAATSSLSDAIEAVRAEYNIDYCIAQRDETVMKTIIRSSPGYLLIKDGVIKAKYHYNDAPDAEEIQSVLK